MKRSIFLFILALLAVIAFIAYNRFLSPATRFEADQKFFYINTYAPAREAVLQRLEQDSIVKNPRHFDWLAGKMDYWEKIRPGKYKITRDMSVLDVVRLLRSGIQTPSRLVINKLRVPEDLARLLGRSIETDSATALQFLNNTDTLAVYGLTRENWPSYIIPDTYEVLWTWTPGRVINKLKDDHKRFWDRNERRQKAEQHGLSPEQVHIL
ncbi:MAG TPA: endolytic transglycosylase MltG, partial [Phnomibacter sp.]|nr:endolytic transglycosylase MltG [Phnomibacter sp.]